MSKLQQFVRQHSQGELLASAAKAVKEYDLIRKSEGDYFLDIDKCTHPEALRAIGNSFLQELGYMEDFYPIDKLAFMEKEAGTLGMLPFAAYFSQETDIPVIYVKLGRESPDKIKGREILYLGSPKPKAMAEGESVIPLMDSYDGTNLGELIKAAEVIRSGGGLVRASVAFLSKNYANREELAKNRIQPNYVFDTNMLLKADIITNDNVTWPSPESPLSGVMYAKTSGIEER